MRLAGRRPALALRLQLMAQGLAARLALRQRAACGEQQVSGHQVATA
jgi:hypothetical protein